MARRHGTSACYKGGCRRDECRAANREYQNNYRRRRAYGLPTNESVDATPVREHLQALIKRGVGPALIGKLADVEITAINRLVYPIRGREAKQVSVKNARKLLSVPLPEIPADTLTTVDAAGSRRRVQALVVLGWSVVWQAGQIGIDQGVLYKLTGGAERVSARTARRLAELYDRYWNVAPPVSRAVSMCRRAAQERGWLPPLAWDDDLIDLPDADLAVELSRRTAAMDSAELHRCYRASLEGDRSPLIVAAAEEYLARRRAKRSSKAA